jgi:hypothetical protein
VANLVCEKSIDYCPFMSGEDLSAEASPYIKEKADSF